MVAPLVFVVFNAGASTAPPSHVQNSNQIKIRVRLVEALAKVEVRGFDLVIGTDRKIAASLDRMSQWELRCKNGKIRATQVTPSGPGEVLNLQEPVSIRTPAGFLTFRGRPYRDELYIYSKGASCEVVNEVELEKYLDGLVNAEFSSRWNEQAIEAQVVAARTYAYYQMLQARQAAPGSLRKHYDVDATVRDQVYDGSIREDFRASRAVARTQGLLLTVGSAKAPVPMKAFYHSTCGGVTELPQNVWGSPFPGFKRPVRCGFCRHSPVFSWEVPLTAREVGQALLRGARENGGLYNWPGSWQQTLKKGQLLDLRISRITPQGRVLSMRTLWADGPNAVELPISGARFREWIGSARLKSAVFQVASERTGARALARSPAGIAKPKDTRIWRFRGRGSGHGVGMCQWGAKVMGEKGYSMAAILKYYYPDAILRRMW